MRLLKNRSYEPELMDDLTMASNALAQNLKELGFINKYLGGNAITISGIKQLLQGQKPSPLSILDIGCGGGQMLETIAIWGKKENIATKLIGLDANEFMLNYAKEHQKALPSIKYLKADAFDLGTYQSVRPDIATATLFCHHFKEQQLVNLFTALNKHCSIGFVINDLHRHWLAYYAIKYLTALFSKSYLVKNDAPLSVARGFTKNELVKILANAGIRNYSIQWRWAFRWQIVVNK
jgi:2-polyprenyl-3-methyl-5-hydroxy-6-metoxy-1,4-benzoquinol methylase